MRFKLLFLVCILCSTFGLYTFVDAQPTLDLFAQGYTWVDIALPKVKSKTQFSLNSSDTLLQINTNNSGSIYLLTTLFRTAETKKFSWKWQTEKTFQNWEEGLKSHDDFPLRVFFMFYEEEPNKIDSQHDITWSSIRPNSAIAYVWSPEKTSSEFISNPYTPVVQMKALQSSFTSPSTWEFESVKIDTDYQKAFGRKAPEFFRVSVISDSDNLKESCSAKIKDLKMEGLVQPSPSFISAQ